MEDMLYYITQERHILSVSKRLFKLFLAIKRVPLDVLQLLMSAEISMSLEHKMLP
jgi:hypothetical protein